MQVPNQSPAIPDVDYPLLMLSEYGDPFTLRDAFEGVQIFGGIGSGKSSGSGAALARAYLEAGMGGLVLCAKTDERAQWEEYAWQTGRTGDLLIFDHSGQHGFNFLRYEMKRPGIGGGYAGNLVRLFANIIEAIRGQKQGGGESDYWIQAAEQLFHNGVDLAYTATGELSLPMLYDIVRDAPRSVEQVYTEEWVKTSTVNKLINAACARKEEIKGVDKWRWLDFEEAGKYWMQEFPTMDPRPRGSIISQFTTVADRFMRRPFRQLFCDKTTVLPEMCMDGKIIVMDLPVKEFGAAGRAAQVMFKYIWQQAMERRDLERNPRPVYLWGDEIQHFVSEHDMQFMATARSKRIATVYITQNIPNYIAEIGGSQAKARTDSLVGNFATKIFHANSDPETNQKAAEIIGKCWQSITGSSREIGSGGASAGASTSMTFEYEVPPQEFTRLLKGGPLNRGMVEAVVFQNGRVFAQSGKTYLKTVFTQDGY